MLYYSLRLDRKSNVQAVTPGANAIGAGRGGVPPTPGVKAGNIVGQRDPSTPERLMTGSRKNTETIYAQLR